MAQGCLLIGDIGGTNARFALADPAAPGFHTVVELKCADFPTADDAIKHYLDKTGAGAPGAVCLAAAGPVVNNHVSVTNNHWDISAEATRTGFGIDAVRLLNDFEAIAYSIPFLAPQDSRAIGGYKDSPLPDGNIDVAILGPGTGLGMAGLRRRGGLLVPITGEGGHAGFAPETDLQIEILKLLRRRFSRVSAERLVAGSGLENIYKALTVIRESAEEPLSAKDVFERREDDPVASEAVGVFFEVLGQVAGDLALTLGANDGVYIAGGIAKRYPDLMDKSRFRAAFESKGRHSPIVKRIPTRLITHQQPGLLGAAYCVLELSS